MQGAIQVLCFTFFTFSDPGGMQGWVDVVYGVWLQAEANKARIGEANKRANKLLKE